jgi:hypothetical protein
MKSASVNEKITVANALTIIKSIAFGILAAEVVYFSLQVTNPLNAYIRHAHFQNGALIICVVAIIILGGYLHARDFRSHAMRMIQSRRIDVWVAAIFGISLSVSFGGIGTYEYHRIIAILSPLQILLLCCVPFIIGGLLLIRAVQIEVARKRVGAPFFISDIEKKTKDDDLLDISETAIRFAERIYNDGSPDTIVFGIDAPWGIGKSTFVNFCIEYWEQTFKSKIIVYKFNPMRYEDRSKLLEKFVDGLVRTIQKYSFIPEIRPLASRYARLLKGKGAFSLLGISFEVSPGSYTIDDAFYDLESALSHMKKKIIVVVDDLDRLSLREIKDVLFAIKKSFTLPNISYVLCYDTENLVTADNDFDEISEFLEKFVNVKTSLFLNADTLSNYISINFEKALRSNPLIDPFTRTKIQEVMGAVKDIYYSADYHNYRHFLGDVRKIKRLINTLVLLEIENADYENSDFNKNDLINLILIYINYPNVFRKIYDTETGDKHGYFSVLTPYEDGYPKETNDNSRENNSSRDSRYKNSLQYAEYIKSIPDGARYLLDRIFDISRRIENTRREDVPQEITKSYACFNGGLFGGGRNLEEYLKLIVKLSKPHKTSQYRFYLNEKGKLLKGASIAEIMDSDDFSFIKGESVRQQLWRVIINNAHEFSSPQGAELINYILDHIQEYSFFTNEALGLGLRDDLDYFLIALLDKVGWSDANGQRSMNDEANIGEIVEWIFGKGRHANNGVLLRLAKEDRGALGLYDMMSFRLFCSADRDGNLFNIQRALSTLGKTEEKSSPNLVIEEMREISQSAFRIFHSQYIDPNVNLFDVVERLSLQECAGNYYPFVEQKIASGELSIADADRSVSELKSRLKSFLVYQLGNTMISRGVGCGYYDESGIGDNHGIAAQFNDYLFNQCFTPGEGNGNYEHFTDYLLINYVDSFASLSGRNWTPHISEILKVLNRERLASYWERNDQAIRALNLEKKDKYVVTANYTAFYKELPETYKILDELEATVANERSSSALQAPEAIS